MQQLWDYREPADRSFRSVASPIVPPKVIHECPQGHCCGSLAGPGRFQVAAPLQEEQVF